MKDNRIWILVLVMAYLVFPFDFSFDVLTKLKGETTVYDLNLYYFSISAFICIISWVIKNSYSNKTSDTMSRNMIFKGVSLGALLGIGSFGTFFIGWYIPSGSNILLFSVILIVIPILGFISKTEMPKMPLVGLMIVSIGLLVFSGYLEFISILSLIMIITLGIIWSCFLYLLHRFVKDGDLLKLLAIQFSTAALISFVIAMLLSTPNLIFVKDNFQILVMVTLIGTLLINWLEAMIARETSLLVFLTVVTGQGLIALDQFKAFRLNTSTFMVLVSAIFLILVFSLVYFGKDKSKIVDEAEKIYNKSWVANQINSTRHFALLIMFFIGTLSVFFYQEYALVVWAVFLIISSYKKLISIILSSIVIGLITVYMPYLIVPYVIMTLIIRLGSLVDNKNVIIVGLFFYSVATCIYFYQDDLRNSSSIIVSVLLLTVALHFLLVYNYKQHYSSESVFSIISSTPLLLLSLILPHLLQGFDDIFIEDDKLGTHNVSGHIRQYQNGYETYVDAHVRTNPDSIIENNLSYKESGQYPNT